MPRKMTKKDTLNEIRRLIKEEQGFIEELKDDQNPQVVGLVNRARGRVDAFEDILLFANRTKR